MNTPIAMNLHPRYPTPEQQHAAEAVVKFFTAVPEIEAVPVSNRFYDAFREFLQALFIARRTYPIAYDKWIQEQIVEILGLSKLYQQLLHLFEIHNFESHEILDKTNILRDLLDEYAPISV